MELNLRLPKPIHEVQKIMIEFPFTPVECRELHLAIGTKAGKTFGAGVSAVNALAQMEQQMFRWFGPIYLQSKIGYRYCGRFLPTNLRKRYGLPYEPFEMSESGTPEIINNVDETRHNRSIMQFLHAQNPNAVEGEATRCNWLDEFAKYKNGEEFFYAVKTTTTHTRGKLIPFGTPLGKGNHQYKLWRRARDEMEWCMKKGTYPTAMAFQCPTTINPTIAPEVIAEMKRQMPERLYRQYVLAHFLDDGGVFGDVESCLYTEDLRIPLDAEYQEWVHPTLSKQHCVVSIDWGKKHDFLVVTIWAGDKGKIFMTGFMRFRKVKYTEAIKHKIIPWIKNNFGRVGLAIHDATGVGQGLEDEMEAAFDCTVVHNVWNNAVKVDMVNQMVIGIEHQTIQLPFWAALLYEASIYECTINSLGTVRYAAADGGHDDIISSAVQGHWAYKSEYDAYGGVPFAVDSINNQVVVDPNTPTTDEMYIMNERAQLMGLPIPYPDVGLDPLSHLPSY